MSAESNHRARKQCKAICTACGKEFVAETRKNKYCSQECRKQTMDAKRLEYRNAHKEDALRRSRKHYEANKERCKERSRAYREANKEHVAQRDRSYYDADKEAYLERSHRHYETNKEKYLENCRVYRKTEKGKDIAKKTQAAQNAKYPEKRYAREQVAYALRVGKLVRQPCEVCGALRVEAHHEDYSKPLEVNWLCLRHHRTRDKERRERLKREGGKSSNVNSNRRVRRKRKSSAN